MTKEDMVLFMRFKWLYFLISAIVIVPGLVFLIMFGLKPSIDFTGGSLLELKVQNSKCKVQNDNTIHSASSGQACKIINSDLQKEVEKLKVEVGSVQVSGNETYLFKTKAIDRNKSAEIQETLTKKYGKVTEVRFETVGPILGKELLQKTYTAAIIAIFAILSYVAYAFKNIKFGSAAVLALLHDLLVVIGLFAIFGKLFNVEVDSLFVTAVLTTMSFSVHDTIVVFDRIREARKKNPKMEIETLANKAVTETMGRSLNNSLTIIFMLLALTLLGGQTVRWFTVALLIGTITGTYSSPFVATPILVIWQKIEDKKKS